MKRPNANLLLCLAVVGAVMRPSPPSADAASVPAFDDVIFLHHSTGANLIDGGRVRELLTGRGYRFWDHGYNGDGLTDPAGVPAGYDYGVPDDNTNPDGLAALFSQAVLTDPGHPSPPPNAVTGLLRHEVILFKSCFPASAVGSPAMLEEYKRYYRSIRDRADQHADRIFIAFSTPPLHPDETSPGDALRARAFANWLKSPEYLSGHRNLFAFDFFGLLAEPDRTRGDVNTLRSRYRPAGTDSHPNARANASIGPVLAGFIDNAVGAHVSGCDTVPAVPTALSPAAGARLATRRPTLDWDDAPCTVYFQVQLRQDGARGPLLVDEITVASTFRPPSLRRGHRHVWRVAACNGEGCSAWTAWRRFAVE